MIAEMKRVEILCLRRDIDALVRLLQERGVLHVEQVPLAVENAPHYLHRVHLNEEEKAEVATLEKLDEMLRELVPILSISANRDAVNETAARLAHTSNREWRRKVRQWSRELRSLVRQRVNVRDNIEVLANYLKILRALEPLPEGRGAILGDNARIIMLQGDVERAVHALRRRLQSELGSDCDVKEREIAKNSAAAVVRHPSEKSETVGRILEEEGIAPVEIAAAGLKGLSVPETLAALERRIAEHHETLERLNTGLDEFSNANGVELTAVRLTVANRLAQLRILDSFAVSELVAVVHGWVPGDELAGLEGELGRDFQGTAVVAVLASDAIERKRIPTLLRNRPAAEPFEVLLSLFGPAAYGSFDPTALVGVFFVFFYGFILGDVAYGLAILGLAAYFKRRFGHIDLVRKVTLVAIYCGISAIFFGFMFGEFLGDFGARYLHMPHIWFHRGHDTNRLLLIAVCVGAVHVVLSLVIAIREGLRHHDRRHMGEKLGLLLGLIAVGIGAVSYMGAWPFGARAAVVVAVSLTIVSVVLLVRSCGALAPLQVIEVVSLVSNVLSYSRLMALGLASVILADIANEMGGKAGNIVLGIGIAAFMHILNLGIGIFSPTLHSLRLNYVEFLPKFYSPDGRVYAPFRKETL
ncbi:MAG TPA: V-type ATPase 116kDa subunit family protein [Candidatus Hydrogenedentes bacterium]|nr:V-type ATPase 116kDa subunit family protein [Candidatus Hydrogenedentota bacterium]HPG66418.1 V-type ATPase 116kDa subunit family protein [Candidatus Hydrogenedentota bacterium]